MGTVLKESKYVVPLFFTLISASIIAYGKHLWQEVPCLIFVAICLHHFMNVLLAWYAFRRGDKIPFVRAFGSVPIISSLLTGSASSVCLIEAVRIWVLNNGQEARLLGSPLYVVSLGFSLLLTLALLVVFAYVKLALGLTSATTATAIAFRCENNKYQCPLVFNKRFLWFLPPGGHFAWEYAANPEKVARRHLLSEAGVYGRIKMEPTDIDTHPGLTRLAEPCSLYWLKVPKGTCHLTHLDFCYVYETIKLDSSRASHQVIWVDIPQDGCVHNIRTNIIKAIEYAIKDGKLSLAPQDSWFPEDVPARISTAWNYYQIS